MIVNEEKKDWNRASGGTGRQSRSCHASAGMGAKAGMARLREGGDRFHAHQSQCLAGSVATTGPAAG
jgi:hypothetical protein